MYRDFHDNQTVADDQSVSESVTTISGRKTRNSNGSRLVPSSSLPVLRSGKNYSKSDTEGDGQSCDMLCGSCDMLCGSCDMLCGSCDMLCVSCDMLCGSCEMLCVVWIM